MIASAMPEAIRQYSMAVAPDSSPRNFEDSRRIQNSCRRCTGFSRANDQGGNLGWIGCERVEEHAKRSVKAKIGFCRMYGCMDDNSGVAPRKYRASVVTPYSYGIKN